MNPNETKSSMMHFILNFSIRFLLFPAILALAAVGCQLEPSVPSTASPPSGARIFQTKCSKCHDTELALKKYRSEELWRETITRMKEEHHADIDREEIKLLVGYHVERQKQEAAVFEEKCQKCHPGKVFLEQSLTPDQSRAIIKRMQQKAGNTIEDKDVEIIVRYHAQAQQAELEKNLSGIFDKVLDARPDLKRGIALFLKKCSQCHEASRALSVIKDSEVWARTIKRMQHYSKGAISDQEAKELVDFHVNQQQREIDTFRETCTRCHDDERINSRSMSEEEWLATIRKMQQKAPQLITDEKVILLSAYFHRRELTMARIFSGKCRLCHAENEATISRSDSYRQLNGLIALANDEFGNSLRLNDVNNLLSLHLQRQQRTTEFFEKNCVTCHPGISKTDKPDDDKNAPERSRAEWISFIAFLQGLELSKENQASIDSHIDFHRSRH